MKCCIKAQLLFVEGDQSSDLPEVQRLCQGTICLETLLLEFDQRGNPVSERLPPPSPRDCPRHPQETGPERDETPWLRWPQSRSRRRGQGGGQRGIQEDSGRWRRQGRSCRTWLRSHGVQRRIWSWQASASVTFLCLLYVIS